MTKVSLWQLSGNSQWSIVDPCFMKHHDLTIYMGLHYSVLKNYTPNNNIAILWTSTRPNLVPNTKRKFRFTVSVLTYAMSTYNNTRGQYTELPIVAAHIIWVFLAPMSELASLQLFLLCQSSLIGRDSMEWPLHRSLLEIWSLFSLMHRQHPKLAC